MEKCHILVDFWVFFSLATHVTHHRQEKQQSLRLPPLPFSVCSFYWSETLIGHFSLRSMTVIGNATVNPCAIRICQAAFIRLIRQKWTLALVRRYTESFTLKFKQKLHRFGSKSKHVLLLQHKVIHKSVSSSTFF